LRFVDAVTRRDKGDRPAIQHLIDKAPATMTE
jgi:hypothetical protein